ncbi:hypothetical protein [Salinarimonas sp.]|uniref:hypothetical protein n=1 Tax=Salinarimonas sp. TaxID=2766526 RepID=UPI0032D91B88
MPRAAALTADPQPIRWRRIGLPAAFLMLAIAAGLAALALWSRMLIAPAPVAISGTVAVALADRTLVVPRAWLIEPHGGRPVARLALEAPLRELLDRDTIPHDLAIGLAIQPADDAPAPSDRPALLYNRFLLPGAESTADGLVRRVFEPSSPYAGEALFLAPPQGRAFAARCLDGAAAEGVRLPCLAEIRRAGLDVQVRLPRAALGHWSRITAAVDGMVTPTGR